MPLTFSAVQDIVTSDIMIGNRWIYRGHANRAWKLETSYSRFFRQAFAETKVFALEPFQSMLNKFIRRASEYSGTSYVEHSLFQQIALAQHHGIPTPMLDWSYSPYVAAYFALADPLLSANRNVVIAIHAIDVTSVDHLEQVSAEQPAHDLSRLDFGFIDTPIFSFRRITRQLGCFTFQSFAGDLREWSKTHSQFLTEKHFKVFEVEGDRLQLLQQLELMGISGGSLFDDLDYIARDVIHSELANASRYRIKAGN